MPLTLDEVLGSQARSTPDRVLYEFLDDQIEPVEAITFAQLHARAIQLAAHLAPLAKPGEPVLVATGPGTEHPVALFACFIAGATAVPVYPPQPATRAAMLETLASIIRACGARVMLATHTVADDLLAALGPILGDAMPVWIDIAQPLTPGLTTGALPGSSPNQPALLLYTSGSTGQPKGAILTHEGLLGNLRALVDGCGRSSEDVVCSWLPQSHIAGLFFRLLPIVVGGRGVLMPVQAFASNPTHWLRAISRHGATVTAAPDFAYAITAQVWEDAARTRPELQGLFDLTRLSMAVSGGEMVRSGTLEAFSRALGSCGFETSAFHPYYGLTETMCVSITQRESIASLSVSRAGILLHRVETPHDDADRISLIGNGSPVGDTQVAIVDPDSRQHVGANGIGEIWVRGGAVIPGYFRDTVPTSDWQGRLPQEAEDTPAFFRTGDLGFIHDGQLYVTGRLKELIIVRGKNHYPLDIEATVVRAAADTGMTQCVAFALKDSQEAEGLGLALEFEAVPAQRAAFERKLRSAVTQAHGLSIDRLFVMPKDTLPRTTTRKIPRLSCARMAQTGLWQEWELAARSENPPTDRTSVTPASRLFADLEGPVLEGAVLGQVLAQLGRLGQIPQSTADLDRPLTQLGLSSLHMARLAHELGQALGIELPIVTLINGETVRGVTRECIALLQGEAGSAGPERINWQSTVDRLCASLCADTARQPKATEPGVLLTGATGFLGRWLLHALLSSTTHPVICLIRASSDAHAQQRVREALGQGPGWKPEFADRLQVKAGDLSENRLGLSEADFDMLVESVGTILHNAADVNFTATYAQLIRSNVEPLAALFELATAKGHRRSFHFISTTAILYGPELLQRPGQPLRTGDFPASPEAIHNGYGRSKWVAEAALRSAAQRGLSVHIHRPSIILGDLGTGATQLEDLTCRFVLGCSQMGSYPCADIGLNLIAVDQAAQGIVASIGGSQSPQTLHWSLQEPLSLRDAMRRLADRGRPIEPISLDQWLERVRSSIGPDNALYPLRDFLLQRVPGTDKTLLETFDGLPMRLDVADSLPFMPSLSDPNRALALVDAMAVWLEASGLLVAHPRPPAA